MKQKNEGWICGALGVIIFSCSMPATQVALMGFSPLFLTLARASLAGFAAFGILFAFPQVFPTGRDFISLLIIMACVVFGFPLLSALALQQINAAQAQIFLAILPLFTALFGVIRTGERPRTGFWIFAILGGAGVLAVALHHGGGVSREGGELMLTSIITCGLGYAEGAKLSRKLGSWQVICWALVLGLPLGILLSWLNWPEGSVYIPAAAWAGLGYVSFFSMLIGFVFWYRGLALGGIAAVSQIQLLQPGLGLIVSSLLLNEVLPPIMLWTTLGGVFCVCVVKRFS